MTIAARQVGPGVLDLTGDELEWINKKWKAIRRAQTLADAANNDWKRLNDEINNYIDRLGVADVQQRALIKGESLALKDALGVGQWHSADAQRHIDDAALFLRMKELKLL